MKNNSTGLRAGSPAPGPAFPDAKPVRETIIDDALTDCQLK
jgi:hypothetical protein